MAVNPFLIYFSGLILSETLFTAMMVWGMVLLLYGEVRLAGIAQGDGAVVGRGGFAGLDAVGAARGHRAAR